MWGKVEEKKVQGKGRKGQRGQRGQARLWVKRGGVSVHGSRLEGDVGGGGGGEAGAQWACVLQRQAST